MLSIPPPLPLIREKIHWKQCIRFLLTAILSIYTWRVTAQTELPATDPFKQKQIGQLPVITPPVPSEFSHLGPAPLVNIQPSVINHQLYNNYNNINEQNRMILQQHGLIPGQGGNAQQVQQFAEIERDLLETEFYRKHLE